MKNIVTGLVIATAGWYMYNARSVLSPVPQMVESKVEATASSPKIKPKSETFAAHSTPSVDVVPVSKKDSHAKANADDSLKALNETNMASVIDTNDLVQKLRKLDSEHIAQFFSTQLSRYGADHAEERGRLFVAANALQSDALLPFWKDLALRLTPAFPDEAALLSSPEPTLNSRVLMGEISMAIRNLGLISYRDPEAADILKQIAMNPDPNLHSVTVREYAFDALKEANQVASLQVLQSLASDDPLREAIKNAAKITH